MNGDTSEDYVATVAGHPWDELRRAPTAVLVGGHGYHESLLRGCRVLEGIRCMLRRGDSRETILEFMSWVSAGQHESLELEDKNACRIIRYQQTLIDRLRGRLSEAPQGNLEPKLGSVSQPDGAGAEAEFGDLGEPVG